MSAADCQHLFSQLGRVLELTNRFSDAVNIYEEMASLGKERQEPGLELAALMAQATIYATLNPLFDPHKSQILSESAVTLARQLGDRAAEAKILWNLMLVNIWSLGDFHKAVEYGEESLAIARELDLREQIALTLSDLYHAYNGVGQLALAQTTLVEARELWRELNNQVMLANNLFLFILSYYVSGDF